jgi:hypothetical protein
MHLFTKATLRVPAASTSFLVGKQFDIKDIIGAAGWTKEERFTAFIIGTLF